MLPKVVPLVEDLQRRVAAYRRRPTDPVAREIEALLREIAELGVEVKDPDRGLIDFRSERRGREHAIVRALRRSPSAPDLLAAPGNAGIARDARTLELGVDDLDGLVAAARNEAVDLVVVGPEAPLV